MPRADVESKSDRAWHRASTRKEMYIVFLLLALRQTNKVWNLRYLNQKEFVSRA